MPFLGIGLEELNLADWDGGTVSLTLLSITGPGAFRLWQDDGLGGQIDFINTETPKLTFDLAPGSHTHFNWGFTELGEYALEFEISGMHIDDLAQSGSATYAFAIPEPSTALLALGGLLLSFRRRR